MGFGLARASTISSSLPAAAEEEGLLEEEILDGEEGDGDEVDALDIDAQVDGYADHADKVATESAAKLQGWRPLAEYRGKPGGWKTAKAFIDAGQNYLPFVQKENRELKATLTNVTGELDGMRAEMASTRAEMQKLLEFSRRASQEGYDKAVRELKAQQREAVAAGDTTRFDEIEGQLGQMRETREEATDPEPAPVPQPRAPGLKPEYQEFIEQNGWFNTDRLLNAAMIEAHNDVIATSPGLSLADQLERAKEAVMAQFPKKFGIDEALDPQDPPPPRRRAAAAPLAPAPGNRLRPSQGRTGIDAIADPRERSEARRGFEQAKKSMPNLKEEEYLAVFNDPHTDVLQVITDNKSKGRK